MGEVSLFSTYSNRENRVTNYCGVMLKLLWQERPDAFDDVLKQLTSNEDISIGPQITQQRRDAGSVPDLVVAQSSFKIAFEVKLSDWFHNSQLEAHISGLAAHHSVAQKVLVLLTKELKPKAQTRLSGAFESAEKSDVLLAPVTFDELLSAIKNVAPRLSESFGNLLKEFEAFLSKEDLLPDWLNRFVVVNSTQNARDITDYGAYYCPDTGYHYSFRRSRYLGGYTGNNTVTAVAEIEGLVVVSQDDDGERAFRVSWSNAGVVGGVSDSRLKERATAFLEANPEKAAALSDYDLQVFVLGPLSNTEFRNPNPSGLWGTKTYFTVDNPDITTVTQLAAVIDGQVWPADKVIR